VVGWSRGAARRNTAWLQSVDGHRLPPVGLALTLTMGGWPDSPESFHAARRAFLAFAAREGWTLQHWVVESTSLGRPHLHMALFGGGARPAARWMLVLKWLSICDKNGWPVTDHAQTVEPITSLVGWLKYVSKHGARGVSHYQRSTPVRGWETTGRLWGHTSNWPTPDPERWDLEDREFYRFRRILVGLVRSRLRASGASSTMRQRVGSQLRNPDESKSRRAGITYWLDADVADAIVTVSVLDPPGDPLGRLRVIPNLEVPKCPCPQPSLFKD